MVVENATFLFILLSQNWNPLKCDVTYGWLQFLLLQTKEAEHDHLYRNCLTTQSTDSLYIRGQRAQAETTSDETKQPSLQLTIERFSASRESRLPH